MKRSRLLFVIVLVTITAAATVFAQRRANEVPLAPGERTDLLARIGRLEDRIANLEAQVRELRGRRTVITTPAIPRPSDPLPPGWQEREFNGMKYYIVPCDNEGTAPATAPAVK